MAKIRALYAKIQKQIPDCGGFLAQTATLLDFVRCKLVFHVSFEEYRQYAFYQLKDRAKRDYVTEHDVLVVIPERFNRSEQAGLLDNKASFNRFFGDLLGREYGVFSQGDAEAFCRFAEGKQTVVIKPTDSWCGHGVQKCEIPAGEKEKRELFETLVKAYTTFLAEECFQQHEQIAQLNPDTVNTLRVISIADPEGEIHIPFASIRIGRKGAVVDNFCAGGMAASIDPQSGMIISGAYDGAGTQYMVHPDTGTTIIGRSIPYWDQVTDTIREAAKRLPEVRFIGWDAVIRNDGKICLLEGNSNPGARTIQMPLKRGIKPDYQKYLGKF